MQCLQQHHIDSSASDSESVAPPPRLIPNPRAPEAAAAPPSNKALPSANMQQQQHSASATAKAARRDDESDTGSIDNGCDESTTPPQSPSQQPYRMQRITATPPRVTLMPQHSVAHGAPATFFSSSKRCNAQGCNKWAFELGLCKMHINDDGTKTDPSALNSEDDLGNVVDLACGKLDPSYAATVGVAGPASTDESSELGSLASSGLASGNTSQVSVASIYSVGSCHLRPCPQGFIRPRCTRGHACPLVHFSRDNHVCDLREACDETTSVLRIRSFGFHCPECSYDVCRLCWPISWEPESSDASPSASQHIPEPPDPSTSPPAEQQALAPLSGDTSNGRR